MKVYRIYNVWGSAQSDGTVKTVMRLLDENLYLSKEEAQEEVSWMVRRGGIIDLSFVKWQKYVIVEQELNIVEEVTL